MVAASAETVNVRASCDDCGGYVFNFAAVIFACSGNCNSTFGFCGSSLPRAWRVSRIRLRDPIHEFPKI